MKERKLKGKADEKPNRNCGIRPSNRKFSLARKRIRRRCEIRATDESLLKGSVGVMLTRV